MANVIHSGIITLIIDGIEVETCVDCAMMIITNDPSDAPATPGCSVCSTKPPGADEEGVKRYEEMIKKSGYFKASLGHIEEHVKGVA